MLFRIWYYVKEMEIHRISKLNNLTIVNSFHVTLCNDMIFFECQDAKLELFALPLQIVIYWVDTDYFFNVPNYLPAFGNS